MPCTDELLSLYRQLKVEYILYCQGSISEREYCLRARPIDEAIAQVELSTIRGSSVLSVSYSQKLLTPRY